jgi:hypothetical protein
VTRRSERLMVWLAIALIGIAFWAMVAYIVLRASQ